VLLAACAADCGLPVVSGTWVAARGVAAGSIAALDRGVAGERYLLIGCPEDTISTAAGCNRACEIAGVDHRVEDLDYRSDPEALTAAFGRR
jgi:dihydroflavonol-4-reductase